MSSKVFISTILCVCIVLIIPASNPTPGKSDSIEKFKSDISVIVPLVGVVVIIILKKLPLSDALFVPNSVAFLNTAILFVL